MHGSCDPISERHRQQRARRRDINAVVMIGAFAKRATVLPSDLQRRYYQSWQLTRVLTPRLIELLPLEQQLDELHRRRCRAAAVADRRVPATAPIAFGVHHELVPAARSMNRNGPQRQAWTRPLMVGLVLLIDLLAMLWFMTAVIDGAGSAAGAGLITAGAITFATITAAAAIMVSRRKNRRTSGAPAECLKSALRHIRRHRDDVHVEISRTQTADLLRAPPIARNGQGGVVEQVRRAPTGLPIPGVLDIPPPRALTLINSTGVRWRQPACR